MKKRVMEHEAWMARLLDEARRAAADGEAPVAAMVVRGDTVLGIGRNTKTSERCGFAHAELNALFAAKSRLGRRPAADVVLYTTLEPCAMCLGAAIFGGVGTLVYGAPDPEAGAVAMFSAHPVYGKWMPVVVPGMRRPQCEALRELPTFTRATTDAPRMVEHRKGGARQ